MVYHKLRYGTKVRKMYVKYTKKYLYTLCGEDGVALRDHDGLRRHLKEAREPSRGILVLLSTMVLYL